MAISKESIRLLHQNLDPLHISAKTGDSEQAIWRYMEDENIELRLLEKQYFETMQPELERNIAEFKEEFPKEFRIKVKIEKFQLDLYDTRKEFEAKCIMYAQKTGNITSGELEGLEKKINQLTLSIKILMGYEQGITKEQIAKAREYPLDQLVEAKKFMALCPFHSDKKPSFYIKGNFYKCFSCGVSGDAIDLTMHQKGFTFKQAVEYLTTT